MTRGLDQILKDQKSRLRVSMTVCASLLVAAAVLLIAKQGMGWVFLCMAAVMAAALFLQQRRFREELAKIANREALEKELSRGGGRYWEAFSLVLTADYAILERPSLQIYPLAQMDKFEVGLAGEARKVLFLTDRSGTRHPIAETRRGEAAEQAFDEVYGRIRDRFHALKEDREEKEQ